LHVAARKGCAQCIQILLDHGASTTILDVSGNTPLHVATVHNNLSAMEALNPALFEEESSVESVDQPEVNDTSTSFYGSPRESQFSVSNQLNAAWTKSSYYNNIPYKIEEERSSLDSLSDSLTVESLVIENEGLVNLNFVWLIIGIVFSQMKRFCNMILTPSSQSKHLIPKTEPPEHVREAMERYKLLSRQKTFKAGSATNKFSE
jgi:hypothetical protein